MSECEGLVQTAVQILFMDFLRFYSFQLPCEYGYLYFSDVLWRELFLCVNIASWPVIFIQFSLSGFCCCSQSSSKGKGGEYWLIWRFEGETTLSDLMLSKEFPYNVGYLSPVTFLMHLLFSCFIMEHTYLLNAS